MQDHPTLNTAAFSKPRSFFTCVRVLTQREKFQKLNLEKISNYLVYGKILVIHFSLMEKYLS